MKKLIVILLLTAAAVINFDSPLFSENNSEPSLKIIAYYFHGTFRCSTCSTIEKYSKEAIETYFKDDIASGKIAFTPINVEEKKNEHFIKDYKLYTKSLILSLIKDGKEIKSRNLDKIWELVRNKQRFSEYVVQEIDSFKEGAL